MRSLEVSQVRARDLVPSVFMGWEDEEGLVSWSGRSGQSSEAQWENPISPQGEPSPLVAMKTPQPGDLPEHLAGILGLSSGGFLAGPSLGQERKKCPL